LTKNELMRLDFSKMDFSEIFDSLRENYHQETQSSVNERVQQSMKNIQADLKSRGDTDIQKRKQSDAW